MNNRKCYAGIDTFRLLAAFLVVAIHTSPLASFSETGDFILTRIVARVAVPFFLMTSGFFLLAKHRADNNKLAAFVKKTAGIYGLAIVLYLPLNLYNGYFSMDNLLPNLIKDLVFDGTVYHLWYLPASIIGAVLAWFAVKRLGFHKALLVTAALYVIGLFGDSYYGLAEQVPFLKGMYSSLFEVSDYTRNGIFFAPVFFVLGGILADRRIRISFKNSLVGFGLSFLLLFGEGMLLHSFAIQRHDSMYLFLLPCMYFLFQALTFWRGKRNKILRTSALLIYIIHPMVIVAVRMLAKFTHMQAFLVENSLVHFLAVSVLSGTAAVLAAMVYYKIRDRKASPATAETERAWIELNVNNLRHNVKILKAAMPEHCELMAVVKAEAYGHGAFETAVCCSRMGVKAFAVATLEEGIQLRRYGVRGEILILGFTSPLRARELHKFDLTQTLLDYEYALRLSQQGMNVKAHLKVDTGMHRLGFDSTDIDSMKKVFELKHLDICGIYTHLCVSDSLAQENVGFTQIQIDRFDQSLTELKESGIQLPKTHIQSSYGLLNYPELRCNYVRVGIALYGVLSQPNDQTKLQLDLRPVLSLKAQVVLLRNVQSGESVGYGRAFTADKDSRIAVLSIGYADGLPRDLSCGSGEVLLHGQRVPIIGRICMDQLAIDVTDVEAAAVGDIATLIGKDGDEELSAAEAAADADSISNELLSRMGHRLKIIEA